MIGRILKSICLSGKPAHLILHVTDRCNLRCSSCFIDLQGHKRQRELTLAEIKALASYMKGLVWLDIAGGEPFLRDDLPEVCACFDAGAISVPTNGFDSGRICDMTRRIRNTTRAAVSVAVSLDGFQQTNDAIRGEDCFDRAVKTLALLRAIKGVRVKVNTVLCEKNYCELIDFMEYIKGFGVDFHSIIFLRGKPRDPQFKLPSHDKLLRIKDEVFRMWDSYDYGMNGIKARILKNYQKLMYETSLDVIRRKRQLPRCLALRQHLVVYAGGEVAFCEALKPFGSLREARIEALLKSDEARMQRRLIAAGECYCHHNCNMLDNFFLNPVHYPKLLAGAIWNSRRQA